MKGQLTEPPFSAPFAIPPAQPVPPGHGADNQRVNGFSTDTER
jgi:hypothetical protein